MSLYRMICGTTIERASIVSWLYLSGASVTEGEVLCEVMVEKAQSDLLSPASGILTIVEEADAIVSRGQVIGRVD